MGKVELRRFLTGAAVIALCGAWAPAALAQSEAVSEADEAANADEIVVTARFKKETLQDVPQAISAFSEAKLDRQAARTGEGAEGFVFVTRRDVPYTNNVSERHLRPSVIFRKVTNGFRCEWGAETYAAFRSVVSTAKANGASVLDTLRLVLAAKIPVEPMARVG